MSIALFRSVLARSCFSLRGEAVLCAVRRSRGTKVMASITIDSSPLLLAGPPSPLSEAEAIPLLDLESPPSALEALAWPPQTTKKTTTKKRSKGATTKKPAAPRPRKKKKPLLSTILPPDKAVASVQQLASAILYPPPLEATEKNAKTPNFKTQGWRTWLSELTNASLRQPESDASLWATASGQSPSAIYQSRVLAHAQTMTSSSPATVTAEDRTASPDVMTTDVPDVCTFSFKDIDRTGLTETVYKQMLARLVKDVWRRCAVEQEARSHRLALFQQSVPSFLSIPWVLW